MIPKIMHHVWIGPKPLPEKEKLCIQSWKTLHSSWEFMLWDNNKIKDLNINRDCRQAIEGLEGLYACQADIIRYIIINKFGGFYLDADIKCFKNIDDLINDEIEFFGLRPHEGNWITNAFFGSIKQSDILNSAISRIHLYKFKTRNPYGPIFFTNNFLRTFNLSRKKEIDSHVNKKFFIMNFYKFWSQKNNYRYCQHYFNASWIKKG